MLPSVNVRKFKVKYLHDSLGSDPLDLLSPAGTLC